MVHLLQSVCIKNIFKFDWYISSSMFRKLLTVSNSIHTGLLRLSNVWVHSFIRAYMHIISTVVYSTRWISTHTHTVKKSIDVHVLVRKNMDELNLECMCVGEWNNLFFFACDVNTKSGHVLRNFFASRALFLQSFFLFSTNCVRHFIYLISIIDRFFWKKKNGFIGMKHMCDLSFYQTRPGVLKMEKNIYAWHAYVLCVDECVGWMIEYYGIKIIIALICFEWESTQTESERYACMCEFIVYVGRQLCVCSQTRIHVSACCVSYDWNQHVGCWSCALALIQVYG